MIELEATHPKPSTLVVLGTVGAVLLFGLAIACLWMVERAFT